MFLVLVSSCLDDAWLQRDERMFEAAGRPCDTSEAGVDGKRWHRWYVKSLDEARDMRDRLLPVQGTRVMIREK